MIRSAYIILLLYCTVMVKGQSLDSLQQWVGQNNPQLIALGKWLEAEETRARTGIYPDNPEVSYNYLWGALDEFGDQKEFEIIQPFRFPGYYTTKLDLQELQYEQKSIWAGKVRQEVMHRVRTVFYNLAWLDKKRILLENRLGESEELVSIMMAGFERGEISRPAFDRARILNIDLMNQLLETNTEIEVQMTNLQQLNGGNSLPDLSFEFPDSLVIPDMDSLLNSLMDKNPDIRIAAFKIAESDEQVKLEKMVSLPEFEAGFKSENILNQKLNGIHAGITIPLWENKNEVKQARLENQWQQASYLQVVSELRAEMVSLYNTLQARYLNYMQMKEILGAEQVSESSMALLQAGQISFPEYLIELQFILDNQFRLLETEKESFILRSELLRISGG